jgi:hypothetical protein
MKSICTVFCVLLLGSCAIGIAEVDSATESRALWSGKHEKDVVAWFRKSTDWAGNQLYRVTTKSFACTRDPNGVVENILVVIAENQLTASDHRDLFIYLGREDDGKDSEKYPAKGWYLLMTRFTTSRAFKFAEDKKSHTVTVRSETGSLIMVIPLDNSLGFDRPPFDF